MKWLVAVLAVAFMVLMPGGAVAAPLDGNPPVVVYSDATQDLRSPDAASGIGASGSVDTSSGLAAPSDDGLGALYIALMAVGGVLAFGGAAYTLRRVRQSQTHTVA